MHDDCRNLSEGLAWSSAGDCLQHLTALTIEGGKTGRQDPAFWQALGDMTGLKSLSLGGHQTGTLPHHFDVRLVCTLQQFKLCPVRPMTAASD